jgi:hypothetical protein
MKQLDNVINLYATNATYLPADGTRVSGQNAKWVSYSRSK